MDERRAELRADKHGLALNDNLTTDTARPGFMGTTRWLLLAIDQSSDFTFLFSVMIFCFYEIVNNKRTVPISRLET